MQTVPSLVGSGTAIAAAALGLVFAQPDAATDPSLSRPLPNRRRANTDFNASLNPSRLSSAPVASRPGTNSGGIRPSVDESVAAERPTFLQPSSSSTGYPPNSSRQRPSSTQWSLSRTNSRRQSFIRQGELTSAPIAEVSRDSVSSNGSWMRRLSIRPLSQHGSFLSSTGPDSQSIAFSHGSSAPILSPTGSVAPLPPNKLVKRAPSAHQNGAVMRHRSKSHLPTLRRPATSHQRSATQRVNLDFQSSAESTAPKFSFDQQQLVTPAQDTLPRDTIEIPRPAPPTPHEEVFRWTSFFHSRTTHISNVRGTPDRLLERGTPPLAKRIRAFVLDTKAIYIVKSTMVDKSTSGNSQAALPCDSAAATAVTVDTDPVDSQTSGSTPENTPTKRVRRSLSTHFSSPNSVFSKSGSLRRPKRVAAPEQREGIRHVSAPVAATQTSSEKPSHAPSTQLQQGQSIRAGCSSSASSQAPSPQRNSSAPNPPSSRLSSFSVDLSKSGTSAAAQRPRSNQPSGSSQSSAAMASFRNTRHERSSTLTTSDQDVRDFNSGDDDDTDFKSDTMFDSVRTMASTRNRAAESPLESMFDESPPSTAGNLTKTKRLSIQEILGRAWDSEDRIMEEDENMQTPVRQVHEWKGADGTDTTVGGALAVDEQDFNGIEGAGHGLSRLSVDDDFDIDWARDDDEMAFGNQLSPPSSMNSRGVSPNLRFALASISPNKVGEMAGIARRLPKGERPRSNIFDWTESAPDKPDAEGHSARPRTVHGKQEMDLRGGRPSNRKGPFIAHVRSQSVPVVYDPSDTAKTATQKYGTWGLGTKGASEDWDDDFEFGSVNADEEDNVDRNQSFNMVVPASIQASQPSLKQHSGQIRELSLLVNDLKRLCRHGRDLDMMDGAHTGLWKEAEGIIALASPDEDELEGMDVDTSDIDFEPYTLSERPSEDTLNARLSKEAEDPITVREFRLAKTTVIRERPSGRRRSVFSPDDDIFGGHASGTGSHIPSRPKTPENNINMGGHDVTDIVKSVLDAMQHRSIAESSRANGVRDEKVHFGTNNLKALVKRAGDLRDILSEVVRRADQITQSPARTPRRSDRDKESPAFTRVFTPEPLSSSPPKRLPHSQSANSALSRGSHESSPSSRLARHVQMMTVS